MPLLSEGQGVAQTQSMKLGSAAGVSLPPGESKPSSGATALTSSAPPFQLPRLLPASKHPTKGTAPQRSPALGVARCQPSCTSGMSACPAHVSHPRHGCDLGVPMDPDGESRLLSAEVTLLEGNGFSVLVLFVRPVVPPCTPPRQSLGTALITSRPGGDYVSLND